MELMLIKLPGGKFSCSSEEDEDKAKKIKNGVIIGATIVQKRNPLFHKKFFAMIGIGFDAFNPPEKRHNGIIVQKNAERFRKDVIISAGYYDLVTAINGEVRPEAHSISFGRMSQEHFVKLYNDCWMVLHRNILAHYTREDLDRVVNELAGF